VFLKIHRNFPLHSIKQFFFLKQARYVLQEVRTELLHAIQANLLHCFQIRFTRSTRRRSLQTIKAENFAFPLYNNNNKYNASQYIFPPNFSLLSLALCSPHPLLKGQTVLRNIILIRNKTVHSRDLRRKSG
jgi:hypothetical protein